VRFCEPRRWDLVGSIMTEDTRRGDGGEGTAARGRRRGAKLRRESSSLQTFLYDLSFVTMVAEAYWRSSSTDRKLPLHQRAQSVYYLYVMVVAVY